MEKYLALVYLSTGFLAASAAFCQSPFISLQNYCYYFSEKKDTWISAREACKEMGSMSDTVDLAVFDKSCDDYVHIINHVIGLEPVRWWIGGTDDHHEGYWRWVDGRPIDMIKGYWSSEEPSALEGENSLSLCMFTEQSYNRWRIEDYYGNTTQHYICQMGVEE
ncbi:hepatic lectin-like [Palaemon carinicauda]|uniref:hepatic lectin-like n=1 Tax=Palaemon carinicauda TaxID=392227 RepID=UPI0035B5DEF7